MLEIEATAKQSLSRSFLTAIQSYYANPLNAEKFKEWQNTHKKEEETNNG